MLKHDSLKNFDNFYTICIARCIVSTE